MTHYILTVHDEPDNPIILTQEDFDLIYRIGLTKPTENKQSTSKENNTVDFASMETLNNTPYKYEGSIVSEEDAEKYFGAGLMTVISEALERYRKKGILSTDI